MIMFYVSSSANRTFKWDILVVVLVVLNCRIRPSLPLPPDVLILCALSGGRFRSPNNIGSMRACWEKKSAYDNSQRLALQQKLENAKREWRGDETHDDSSCCGLGSVGSVGSVQRECKWFRIRFFEDFIKSSMVRNDDISNIVRSFYWRRTFDAYCTWI